MKLYRWEEGWPSLQIEETPFEVVPWCAEHDRQMRTCLGMGAEMFGCRLEDPPRHLVIGGEQ